MIDSFTGNYRFLSNFFPSEIEVDGHVYPTVEHAYQASKTYDPCEREAIRLATTPGRAKAMGRKVTLRPAWNSMRIEVMRDLLRKKFSIPVLRSELLATQDQRLVEGNHWGDTFWGICGGVGENHLGKLLMEVRDELR